MRRGRRTSGRRLAALAMALAPAFPAAAADSPAAEDLLAGAVRLPCETASIDVGDPAWRPALAGGFYGDERWGEGAEALTVAWTGREATVALVLAAGGERTLAVTAHAAAPGIEVAALLDGRPLGRRPVAETWGTLRWTLPADLATPGPHRLRLAASRAVQVGRDPRLLALAVERIELSPAVDCGAVRPPALPGPEGVELAPGEVLVAPLVAPPAGRALVRAAGPAGAALDAFLLREGGSDRLGTLAVGTATGAELPLPRCCERGAAVVLIARGGGPIAVTALAAAGDRRPAAWRRACGLLWREGVALAALLALAAALVVRGRRVRAAGVPASPAAGAAPRWRPWLDAALVAALAVAVRWAFLQAYPEPGRSADAYEYLMRSARLALGRSSFLHDTDWHAWQTWIRPPGYYLFLAAVRALGGGVAAVIGLQALASGIAAGATCLAVQPLFGRTAALVAGLAFALYAESVVTFSRILSEPLYLLFLAPALAALSWTAARPTWRLGALAGALFGLAALVRSAPVYFVPLAALALVPAVGARRAWRPGLAMAGAMVLTIAPWAVRNSAIYGAPIGVDDLAVANLLQVRPDQRFVAHEDLDLETAGGWNTYYQRLQRANRDRALGRRGGEVLRATLGGLAARPGEALATLGTNLREYFGGFGPDYFRRTHGEERPCRVAWVTDLLNLQHAALLLLAAAGFALTVRDRRAWPLALWFVFNAVVINLLFHPEPKYRLPTLPVAMAFAGAALAALAGRLPARPRAGAAGAAARVVD